MKASEAFKQGYKEKKDEIFRNILAQAGAYTAQPSTVNKEIDNKVKENGKMDKIKVKRGATGLAAIAACALVAAGLGYAGGIFDDKPDTEPKSSVNENEVQQVFVDEKQYDSFSDCADAADEVAECVVEEKSYILLNGAGEEVVEDEAADLSREQIMADYDVYTVYKCKISFVHKGAGYIISENDPNACDYFMQQGGIINGVTYDYGKEKLDIGDKVLLAGQGTAMLKISGPCYRYNSDTKEFTDISTGIENKQIMEWIEGNFVGRNVTEVMDWYTDKGIDAMQRAMFEKDEPLDGVCRIEEENGEKFVFFSKGPAEYSEYMGMNVNEAKSILEENGENVLVKYMRINRETDTVVGICFSDEIDMSFNESKSEDGYAVLIVSAGLGVGDSVLDIEKKEKVYASFPADIETKFTGFALTEVKGEQNSFDGINITPAGIGTSDGGESYDLYFMITSESGQTLGNSEEMYISVRGDSSCLFNEMILRAELENYGNYYIAKVNVADRIENSEFNYVNGQVYMTVTFDGILGVDENGDYYDLYEGIYQVQIDPYILISDPYLG